MLYSFLKHFMSTLLSYFKVTYVHWAIFDFYFYIQKKSVFVLFWGTM